MSDGWLVKRELLVSDEIREVALLALITACNNTGLAQDGTSGLQSCGQTHGHCSSSGIRKIRKSGIR